MGESKHTPKWTVHDFDMMDRPIAPYVRDEFGRVVATCPTREGAERLTAWPLMLEALRKMVGDGRHRLIDCEIGKAPKCRCGLADARAAIKAATGGEP